MHCLALPLFLLATVGCIDAKRSRSELTVTYFMFSQQWSPGVCSAGHEKCLKSKERNFWTIHGLWPSSNTSDPEFCNRTLQYNVTVLSPILTQLDQYWPSMSEDNNKFWKHEWLKHGTCATVVPKLTGLYNFFNTTLNIYLRHNITHPAGLELVFEATQGLRVASLLLRSALQVLYLRRGAILPTSERTYTLQQIKDALHRDIKEAANFVCRNSQKYSAPLLAEIRLCLNRELQYINCQVKHSACDEGDVYYLAPNASLGKGGSISLTPPFTWLLHCSWLFAVSVIYRSH